MSEETDRLNLKWGTDIPVWLRDTVDFNSISQMPPVEDPDYVELGRRVRSSSPSPPDLPSGQFVIEAFLTELPFILTDEQRSRVSESLSFVRIASLDLRHTYIVTDGQPRFAVLFPDGYPIVLHSLNKLRWAASDPMMVGFCPWNPSLDAALFEDEKARIINEYKAGDLPVARPLLIEDPRALYQLGTLATAEEFFILGHETAHLLAGHLDNDSRFISALVGGRRLSRFDESGSRSEEVEADIYGFDLAWRAARRRGTSKAATMYATILVLNLLEEVFGGGSDTHPHPFSRAVYVAEAHYGTEAGKLLLSTYRCADADLDGLLEEFTSLLLRLEPGRS